MSAAMMRPQSAKELSADAKNYNYSSHIPLRLWVRSLNLLLGNSNSYLRQQYYDESYKLLIRFCEIMLNKLNNHPEVKQFKSSNVIQQQEIYQEYYALYKRLPLIFEEIDKLKIIVDKRYHDYMVKQAELEKQKRSQEEKYLQQRKLYSNVEDRPSGGANGHDHNDEDDDEFFKNLDHHNKSDYYPSAGTHTVKRDDHLDYPALPVINPRPGSAPGEEFRYEFPQSGPALPLKIPTFKPDSPELDHAAPPSVPPKVFAEKIVTQDGIEHKTVNFTEGGLPLRTIFVSHQLKAEFLKISAKNTAKKLETCGILAGKLSRNAFFITHLLIPEQISTPNTCETQDEENLLFTADKLDLFILGWIHTHPTQSCFLSSVDLHTQNSYQIMLNEAIAIVLSPDEKYKDQDFGCFRLTDPPGLPTVSKCNRTGFHPHEEKNLYVTCNRVNNDIKMGHVVMKDHLPFEVIDIRKKKSRKNSN